MFTGRSMVELYMISYAICVIAGFIAGITTKIKVTVLRELIVKLYDPFTVALKKRLHADFMDDVKAGRKVKLSAVIFFNNFIFAALISRTLYGIIFFYPWLLTTLGAFNQGIAIARIGIFNPLLMLEFIAYLFASAAGSLVGIGILRLIILHEPLAPVVVSAALLYRWVAAILLLHTFIEVRFLTNVKLPEGMNIDMENVRKAMRDRLDGVSEADQ